MSEHGGESKPLCEIHGLIKSLNFSAKSCKIFLKDCRHMSDVQVEQLSEILKAIGLDVRGTGSRYVQTLCPFHQDKDPSLTVWVDGGYLCWGCGKRGFVSQLVEGQHSYSSPQEKEKTKREIKKIRRDAKKFKPKRNPETDPKYVEERLFSFFVDCPESILLKRGLNSILGKQYELQYDIENDWIIIPVRDFANSRGRLVGALRRIRREVSGIEEQKYKNMVGFQAKNYLYGLTPEMEKKHNEVILIESSLGVPYMEKMGFTNVVACFTSRVSSEQAELLGRRFEKAVVFFDNDAAGKEGYAEARHILGKWMRVYQMPHLDGHKDEGGYTREELNHLWENRTFM